MVTDTMLRDLYRLSMDDGLSYSELSSITNWAERSKLEFDTSVLSEESRKQIMALHKRHFGG